MKIEWHKVTEFSQIVAIVLFVAVLAVGFSLGRSYENQVVLGAPITAAHFACAADKSIKAEFYKNFVQLNLSDGRIFYLPQTISASGARYANSNESLVFWNKSDTAFITEKDPNTATYKNCLLK